MGAIYNSASGLSKPPLLVLLLPKPSLLLGLGSGFWKQLAALFSASIDDVAA